jgi:hypothetical protein
MSLAYKILGQMYIGLTQTTVPGGGGSGYYYGGGGETVVETLEPTVIYTVPSGQQAIVSSIFAANHDVVERSYDLAVVPFGETLGLKHHVKWDQPVSANDFEMISHKFTLSAGDRVYVFPSTADKFGFTVFGTEISQ